MGERFYGNGILSGPIDLDGGRPAPRVYPKVEARPGLEVAERGTNVAGVVISLAKGLVTVRGADGRDRVAKLREGSFMVAGKQVTLIAPRGPASGATGGPARTASGSVAVAGAKARIARASRILVEGVHDAELVEKVWGDDLRIEGVVVEVLDGADNLAEIVRSFGPSTNRRLGILLDHLVDHSKETRMAQAVDHPDVLITGHPYVDIWAAIKPSVIGIAAWPEIPKGQSWKDGICARVGPSLGAGADTDPRLFWKRLVGSVTTWTDLEPPLVGAVEQLIDFVTEPPRA